MNAMQVEAASREAALARAAEQWRVPVDALRCESLELTEEDDLLCDAAGDENDPTQFLVSIGMEYFAGATARLLEEMMRRAGVEAAVEGTASPQRVTLRVESAGGGGELDWLVGGRGEALESIEYLLSRLISRDGLTPPPVTIEVAGARRERLNYLETLGMKKAARAIQLRREVRLLPMKASERKLMHAMLSELKGVRSYSMGVDRDRHIVIEPDGEEPDPKLLNWRDPNPRGKKSGKRREGARRPRSRRRPKPNDD